MGTVLVQLVIKAICLLENAGAIVGKLVSDGVTSNRKLWSELESGEKDNLKNKFDHPLDNERCIYVFFDAPHLLKNIFSNSIENLKNCYETQSFTDRFNKLFDALNRKNPAEGIQINSKNFEILEDNFKWLDNWEDQLNKQNISKDEFLTKSTADGLRVTIRSIIELSKYLLEEYKFKCVTIVNYPEIDFSTLS